MSLSCNRRERKRRGFSISEIAVLCGDFIEDMLPSLEGIELDRCDAMCVSEWVAAVNVERTKLGQELVALPPAIHLQINEYAELGMYKGKGIRFPRRHSLFEAEVSRSDGRYGQRAERRAREIRDRPKQI
jgi:hypothetical protein